MKNEDKLIMSKKVNLASPKAGAKIISFKAPEIELQNFIIK